MASSEIYPVLSSLKEEVHSTSRNLNPQVIQLVHAFVAYLKEPRFQAPLTLQELSQLFKNFYSDLDILCVNLYTQSNSVKKQLIAQSDYFRNHPEEYDYLLAIANSKSSSKLAKRTDIEAVYQLRVFNYYKLLYITETIEAAQVELFASCGATDEDPPLIEKVFRFDERDILFQEFFDDKLQALRDLKLPFSCFIEHDEDHRLSKYFSAMALMDDQKSTLTKIGELFSKLNKAVTPTTKLSILVRIQKSLIIFLSEAYGADVSKINNDDLIPSLIYIIIYHIPFSECELYLNFNFVKNFLNTFDPYELESLTGTSHSSPGSTLSKHSNKSKSVETNKRSLFDLLNLKDDDNSEVDCRLISFFKNDMELIQYIQSNCLHSGEDKFYFTNFEAVLYFLLNVKIDELSHEITTSNKLLHDSLDKLVDDELLSHFQFPDGLAKDEIRKSLEDSTRSRSSSLLNSIGSRITDVAASVNRSRSNSGNNNNKASGKENFPPLNNTENEGTRMKSILGRLSLVLVLVPVPTFRYTVDDMSTTSVNEILDKPDKQQDDKPKKKASKGRISQMQNRTRASSLDIANENEYQNGVSKGHPALKRNSITNRLTNGVSEFITKFNTANGNVSGPSSPHKTTSLSSLHSLDESSHDAIENSIDGIFNDHNDSTATIHNRPVQTTRNSSMSLQFMDKFFSNLSYSTAPPKQGNEFPLTEIPDSLDSNTKEIMKYWNQDFDQLTVKDLKNLKVCYDKLCHEIISKSYDQGSQKSDHNDINSTFEGSV